MNGPAAQQVIDRFRQDIVQGRYPQNERLEPERILCQRYEVSRPTIRAAIAKLVEEGIVKKIPHKGAHVVPHSRRRILRRRQQILKQTAKTYQIVYARLTRVHETYAQAQGIRRFAQEHGDVEVVVMDAHGSYERCQHIIEQMGSKNSGLFMRLYPACEDSIQTVITKGRAVVSWGFRASASSHSTIDLDEFGGGYGATGHLISTHDVPAYFLGYDTPGGMTRGRYDGWVAAMNDHGFPNHEEYFLRVDFSEDDSMRHVLRCRQNEYQVALRLFKSKLHARYCVFVIGDFTATSVYKAAEEAGLEVGKDVFVVGYHNRPLCKRLKPALSSVSWPAEELGYEGAKLLYEHMTGKLKDPVHKVLPVELKVRSSSSSRVTESKVTT